MKLLFSFFVDKRYVLKKCPYLINEMVSIVAQLVALKHAGRGKVTIIVLLAQYWVIQKLSKA
jgi:hypothetical protein